MSKAKIPYNKNTAFKAIISPPQQEYFYNQNYLQVF